MTDITTITTKQIIATKNNLDGIATNSTLMYDFQKQTNNKGFSLYIATKSIATKSIVKGDIDIYGNVVEYDPNSWVGEDNVLDENVNIKNIFSVQSENEFGILDISLSNELLSGKSNIAISLIDEGYNISNIYLYYRNEGHEKVNLPPGKYTINSISYLANNDIKLEADVDEIDVYKDETTTLLIKSAFKKVIISTMSETRKVNEPGNLKEKISIPTFVYILIVLGVIILVVLISMFLKRLKDRGDE